MNDHHLRAELEKLAMRHRALARRTTLLLTWLVLGLAAGSALLWLKGMEYQFTAVAAIAVAAMSLVVVAALHFWSRRAGSYLWLAHKIEKRHPDLDTRLLAALEQHPDKAKGLGFLQQMVIDQSVMHARRNQWAEIIPSGRLALLTAANWMLFLTFAALAIAAGIQWKGHAVAVPPQVVKAPEPPFTIKVEPGNASIERGTALLVMARFDKERLPSDVELLYRDGNNDVQHLSMSKSLDDPLFALRLASVKRDGTYAIRYGDATTDWYKISVFDYPALKQADAHLKYPEYTGLEEKEMKDTRSVSGVEGTHVTLAFHLNKAVAQAQ
jgi:hypothetical protein